MLEDVPLRRTQEEEDEEEENDENSDEDFDEDRRKSSTKAKRKWDSFRDIPPKQESGSQATQAFIENSVKVQKVLAYIVTFIVVLVGGVISKTCVLLASSQIYPAKNETCLDEELHIHPTIGPLVEERILWTWVLLFVVWLPDIGAFLRALRFCFFKKEKKPNWVNFLVVFLMESLHAIGTALLVFEVLPNLDVIRGAMLTNAVCLVPAILRLLSRNRNEIYGTFKLAADAVAVLCQFSALIAWPLYDNSPRSAWIAPALLFTSCGWWLNYVPESVHKDGSVKSKFLRMLRRLKSDIKGSLYWTYLPISCWKIILTFCTMMAVIAIQNDITLAEFFDNTGKAFQVHAFNGSLTEMIGYNTLGVTENQIFYNNGDLDWLYVAIIASAGSYCCYVFSKFASKIMIQELGLALPNMLVVPGAVVLIVILDVYQSQDLCFSQRFMPHYLFWNTELTENFITEKMAWIWLFWLLSQGWITFHIWFPQNERLASTEKLLTTPMYSGVVVDQSVCMNRAIIDTRDESEDTPDNEDSVPHVIACATMWHESLEEMLEMFKSILRMDMDQCVRTHAKNSLKSTDAKNNYYLFETQIFFDDAFTLESDGSDSYVINSFVRDMMKSLPVAVREVYRSNRIKIAHPEVYPTPYGGRMTYQLPGGSKMVVHLKDKNKIRHRKRWSQCMYMYYLLGYNLMDQDMPLDRKETIAKNTFLLALDGDIDFQPKAVRLLVDLMKKNDNLGAACGRIHPVGSGLMAWYQIFEYAIGHWLQKATEHMIGCVLCSPGCFSLFRGQALMDDNVMKTYTKDCEAASHYVQYDQGEDRWLCTLLLQRGYRVEYSAASDAYTHCPENFNEFYNQRRRWVPSTMANIVDLLGSYKRTVEVNGNISMPYIAYQTMLLGGTILGPGTIFLMLVGAFVAAFKIDNWTSFYYNLIPIILFILVCLFLKSNVQLMFALVISTVYGLIMMAVLVGILIQIQQDGPLAPSTLFLFIVAGEMIIAAFAHPQELYCLPSGAIYYITIPSMYLLLIIYSVCNLNVVSWGTREVAAKKTKQELEEEKLNAQLQNAAKKQGSSNAILAFLESFAPNKKEKGTVDFSFAGLFRCMFCTQPADDERESLLKINDTLVGFTKRLDNIERHVSNDPSVVVSRRPTVIGSRRTSNLDSTTSELYREDTMETENDIEEPEEERDENINPYWIEDKDLSKAKTKFLPTTETKFWKELIERYLKPIDENKEKQKKIAGDLRELRDKMVLSFFMLNALFVTIVFLLQLNKETIYVNWPLGAQSNISYNAATFEVEISQTFLKLEPIGLVFVIFFAIILLIQFTGMFLHRFETLCHVLSTTTIFRTEDDEFSIEKIIDKEISELGDNIKSKAEETLGDKDDLVNRRKTVQILEDEFQKKRPSVNVGDILKKRFTMVRQEEDERERRKSSLIAKRMSTRNSMASKRVTMAAHTNVGFQTIAEDEKEE